MSGWLRQAAARLSAAGVDSPQVDAELLAAHAAGTTRAGVLLLEDPPAGFGELLDRRERREPLQHIVGRAPFRHLDLGVGPGVFIPRPETELVAGAAIDAARAVARTARAPVVVDLGTGSGAIALAVAQEVPTSLVHAVERDQRAWEWARRNIAESARGGGPGARVLLHRADLATVGDDGGALSSVVGEVDVVVSNPPYVLDQPEQTEAEQDPAAALFGAGETGTDDVHAVLQTSWRLLRPGGAVVVEHAPEQAGSVVAGAVALGYYDVVGHRDLSGRPRFATATRPGRQPAR